MTRNCRRFFSAERRIKELHLLVVMFLAITAHRASAEDGPSAAALIRNPSSIVLDGRLDELEWRDAPVLRLVQQSPKPSAATPYETEVRIIVSGDRIFFGFDCKDPPPNRLSVHTMRRDETMGQDGQTLTAMLTVSCLTAWQGLFEHGRLHAGQRVLVHGAAGAVGSMAAQFARDAGADVIGTGRAAARQKALDFGAQAFVDLDKDALEDVGEVDLVFDVIGGDIAKRSAGLIRAGGTLVTVIGPTEARTARGLTIDFVVEPDRARLSEIVQRLRDGRLRTNIGNVAALDDAVAAFNRTERIKGKTIIRVRP